MNTVTSISNAKFSVGDLVHHQLFSYRGVVIDVDPTFQSTEEWYETVARSREEELWRKRDPIPRLMKHLLAEGIVGQERLDAIAAEVDETVRDAMEFAERSPAPPPEALYEDLFSGTFDRA